MLSLQVFLQPFSDRLVFPDKLRLLCRDRVLCGRFLRVNVGENRSVVCKRQDTSPLVRRE